MRAKLIAGNQQEVCHGPRHTGEVPITSPQFVYRAARQTDVRVTFERARIGRGLCAQERRGPWAPADRPASNLVAPETRAASSRWR